MGKTGLLSPGIIGGIINPSFPPQVAAITFFQCKRKIHTRDHLILAQELGEILAIGHNRHVNKVWLEKDREVLAPFWLYISILFTLQFTG